LLPLLLLLTVFFLRSFLSFFLSISLLRCWPAAALAGFRGRQEPAYVTTAARDSRRMS
jgi:hypothetical protein